LSTFKRWLASLLVGAFWVTGCGAADKSDGSAVISASNPQVRIETTAGDIVLELFADKSPIAVENFLSYVNDGSYSNTIFHRVIPGFMIQGGGRTADLVELEGKDEIFNEAANGLANLTGTIALARHDIIDSASRQFFINTANNTSLDHSAESCTRKDEKATEAAAERGLIRPVTCKTFGYPVFGHVIAGMDVVFDIELAETKDVDDFYDVPVTAITITSIKVVNSDKPALLITPVPVLVASIDPAPVLVDVSVSPYVSADADRPNLIVLLAIDQFRNDRIDMNLPGGLGLMAREGRVFTNASLDHGLTNTCPGHAVMMTGMNPGNAGIPGNSYIDTSEWEEKYCVEDDSPGNNVLGGVEGRSPWMLKVSTLGEWIKSGLGGRSFSVSGKDRAAIMMAGHKADGVFWFDREQVRFTTSQFYNQSLPSYLTEFNSRLVGSVPPTWEHDSGRFRQDNYEGEADDNSRVSGHQIADGDQNELGERIYGSPYLDTLTLGLARELVIEEQLGTGATTDLLMVSLSANDTVGHQFGPFSAESEDTLNKIDSELAALFKLLDERVGQGRYLVALTSDHGVADLPEWQSELGQNRCPIEGGRIGLYGFVGGLLFDIYAQFTFPWDFPTDLVKFSGSQLYINRPYLEQKKLDLAQVIDGLKRILEPEAGIKKVWTRAEIENSASEEARLLRNSIVDGASGDLFLQIEEDCIISSTGTTHGSLYDYDRSIPIVFYGFGVSSGSDPTPANSIDIAPTLAKVLNLATPTRLDGKALVLSP
jgi:cyclophilin family peptidyl-prolyl cis-trans isomerase/predicted AlkP superfamily pyrophosphatase or phosphodiesterase